MALAESIEQDKIEVVGLYKHVQIRKATVIKKDGTEMARAFSRYVLQAGTLDGNDALVILTYQQSQQKYKLYATQSGLLT